MAGKAAKLIGLLEGEDSVANELSPLVWFCFQV